MQPYDDPLVMAGQGTAALELLEDVPELDVLLAPVSGGGLIAGCSTVAKALRPGCRVVGVEPETGDDTQQSLAAGERVRIDVPRTIADGLQATEPGELTFEVNQRRVDEVVTVSDEEIVAAMVFLFDRLKLVAEPSGAVGVAALLTGKLDARDAHGRRDRLGRERRRRAIRRAGRLGAFKPRRLISKNVFSAAGDGLLIGRQPVEHPRRSAARRCSRRRSSQRTRGSMSLRNSPRSMPRAITRSKSVDRLRELADPLG